MKHRIGAGVASLALTGMAVGALAAPAFADPLSSGEFKKQANAICQEGNQQLQATARQVFGDLSQGQNPSAEQLQAYAAAAVPNVEQQIDGVAALEPPKSLRTKVKKLVKSARAALAKIEADPSLLADTKHNPFTASDKLAKKLGLKECVSDSTS